MSAPTPSGPTRRLKRSNRYRIVAGVCGGIAEYLDVDPTVVRVVYVTASIFSALFPGVLAYIILTFLMPRADALS
jgi:phage shock protein C